RIIVQKRGCGIAILPSFEAVILARRLSPSYGVCRRTTVRWVKSSRVKGWAKKGRKPEADGKKRFQPRGRRRLEPQFDAKRNSLRGSFTRKIQNHSQAPHF